MVKVIKMNKAKFEPVKVFCDIEFQGLVIKGLKIISGSNGLFVSYPAEKGKDGKYYELVYPTDVNIKLEIEREILNVYAKFKEIKSEVKDDMSNPHS